MKEIKKFSKKLIINLILCLILCGLLAAIAGCGVQRVPVEITEVHYIDSTLYHIDTISVEIPREVIKEIVYADSSHLETSVAASTAVVDSCGFLHHSLENKAENALKKEILWKEKIVYRDSVQIKEVPVEVETIKYKYPKIFYFLLGWGIISMIGAAIMAVLIFKK